jgi:hypothetical protein
VRDTGMPASHYACQSPLNKIGLFLHVTCLRDGVPLGSPTPQLKNRMGLGGLNSAGFPQIFRPFKGIICGDISEFESSHPSHAVGLPRLFLVNPNDPNSVIRGCSLARLIAGEHIGTMMTETRAASNAKAKRACFDSGRIGDELYEMPAGACRNPCSTRPLRHT